MEKEVFKQSLLGFDRNQVIKYIDDLLKQIKDKEIEYQLKQEELENEIKLLQASIGKNETEFSEAKEAVELLKDGILKAAKTNQDLEEKLSKYREFILLKENAYKELLEKHKNSSTDIEKITAENDYWKARQDEISTTLVEARVTAKDIVYQAKEEAEEIKKRFKEDASNLAKEFVGVKRSIEDIESQLEASFSKVKSAISLIDKSSEELQGKITSYSLSIDNLGQESAKTTGKTSELSAKKETKSSLLENVLNSISNLLDK